MVIDIQKFWSVPQNVDSAKIEIVLNLLQIEHTKENSASHEVQSLSSTPFLEVNPEVSLKDPHAILIYLAQSKGSLYSEDSEVLIDS